MPARSDLYHQDYHAWIAGQAALLRQGRTHEIDTELLADQNLPTHHGENARSFRIAPGWVGNPVEIAPNQGSTW